MCKAGRILAELDKDRLATLLSEVAGVLDGVDGHKGWVASLRFGTAAGLSDLGQYRDALPLFRRLVADNPLHAWAWIGLVDALRAVGELAHAVEAGREGLGHLPGHALLSQRTAAALRDQEGPGVAARFFASTLGSDPSPRDLEFGISLFREAGQAGQAAELSHRLLATDPDASTAHLALIEGALSVGDPQAVLAVCRAALARSPEDPELLLRVAQGFAAAADCVAALGVLDTVPRGGAFDAEAQTLRAQCTARVAVVDVPLGLTDEGSVTLPGLACLEDALATGDIEESSRILSDLMSAPNPAWYDALGIVARVQTAVSAAAATLVAGQFSDTAWREGDRQAFEIEHRLLTLGPRFALDWIRTHPVALRDREAAERVGRVLLSGGCGPLAARYLRRCCQRWPKDRALSDLAALASDACGMDEGERPWPGRGPSLQSLARDGARTAQIGLIEASLLAGDLEQAEAGLAALTPEDGPLARALLFHPRATRIGTLLNEARILAAAGIDWTDDDAAQCASDLDGFFLTARTGLAGFASAVREGGVGTATPETVHLIWPSPCAPGREAERLFEAWRGATRREVVVHSLSDGPARMAEAGGKAAVEAFGMARDAAQKADLVMLALAVSQGGAIVSGDQWPSGQVDALFDAATGAVVFRDTDGSVSLDALALPAGHPLAQRGLDRMVASCLGRDNDHRWFKTGPGLMTRVMAQYVREPGYRDAAPRLEPIRCLRRHMYRHATVVPVPERWPRRDADAALAQSLLRLFNGSDPAVCHVL